MSQHTTLVNLLQGEGEGEGEEDTVLDKVFVFLFCTREINQYEGGIRVV